MLPHDWQHLARMRQKARTHEQLSHVKSLLRIAGYIVLMGNVGIAAGILMVAELLGMLEELLGT